MSRANHYSWCDLMLVVWLVALKVGLRDRVDIHRGNTGVTLFGNEDSRCVGFMHGLHALRAWITTHWSQVLASNNSYRAVSTSKSFPCSCGLTSIVDNTSCQSKSRRRGLRLDGPGGMTRTRTHPRRADLFVVPLTDLCGATCWFQMCTILLKSNGLRHFGDVVLLR